MVLGEIGFVQQNKNSTASMAPFKRILLFFHHAYFRQVEIGKTSLSCEMHWAFLQIWFSLGLWTTGFFMVA